jgi:hypothetical protein
MRVRITSIGSAQCFLMALFLSNATAQPDSASQGELPPNCVESGYTIESKVLENLAIRTIYIKIDPDNLIPEIVGATASNPSGISPIDAMNMKNTVLVLGSGFETSIFPPVPAGLLVINKASRNPISKNDPDLLAVIMTSKTGISIIPNNKYSVQYRPIGAIQAGHILVLDNKIAVSKTAKGERASTRSFVGITQRREIIVGITISPAHLYDLAAFLSNSLGCSVAVNLAGGGSEALSFLCRGELKNYGSTNFRRAALILFKKR